MQKGNASHVVTLPEQTDETYTTRDLNLAAALITLKFSIIDMSLQLEGTRQNPVGYFTFENSQNLIDAVKLYLTRQMVVEPIDYTANIRNLKAQVINATKNPFAQTSNQQIS